MPTVTAPGTGTEFEYSASLGPDGGIVFVFKLLGPGNQETADADGLRIPTVSVFRDPSGIPVSVADATLQALRMHVASGASVVQLAIDGSPFDPLEDGGAPQIYATGNPGELPDGINWGVPRLSRYRIIPVGGPPRDLQVQTPTPVRLTTVGEVSLLAAGAPGVYHDMRHLTITTNFVVQQDPSIEIHLRDATTGTIRWTAAIPEKSGGTFVFPVYRNQSTPASAWTAQLSVAPPAGRAVILNAEAERRLD